MFAKRRPVSTVVESKLEFYPKDVVRVHYHHLKNIPDNVSPGRRQFFEILYLAIESRSWSVTIEPQGEVVRVRGRRDGAWRLLASYPAALHQSVADEIARFMRIDLRFGGNIFDNGFMLVVFSEDDWIELFVNVMGSIKGLIFHFAFRRREKSFDADLNKLGFEKNSLATFIKAVDAKNGLVLITGPTHAGKSILTYSVLVRRLARGDSVVTVEAPRKFFLANAVQLGLERNESYEIGVKRALAYDTRVLMVQELSGCKTWEMAMAEAKSSRLVIAATHTSDAVAGLHQPLMLREYGHQADGQDSPAIPLDPEQIAAAIRLVCSPRVLRRLCDHCRRRERAPVQAFRQAGLEIDAPETMTVYTASGCQECGGTGFSGLFGIYEVLPVSKEMKKLIVGRRPLAEFASQARKENLSSLREMALRRALAGETSFQEAILETPPPFYVRHAKSIHRPIYMGEKDYVAPPDDE